MLVRSPPAESARLAIYWVDDRWRWPLLLVAGVCRLCRARPSRATRPDRRRRSGSPGCFAIGVLGAIGLPLPVWYRFLLLCQVPLAVGVAAVVAGDARAANDRASSPRRSSSRSASRSGTLIEAPSTVSYFGQPLQPVWSWAPHPAWPGPRRDRSRRPRTSSLRRPDGGCSRSTRGTSARATSSHTSAEGYALLRRFYVGGDDWWAAAQEMWRRGRPLRRRREADDARPEAPRGFHLADRATSHRGAAQGARELLLREQPHRDARLRLARLRGVPARPSQAVPRPTEASREPGGHRAGSRPAATGTLAISGVVNHRSIGVGRYARLLAAALADEDIAYRLVERRDPVRPGALPSRELVSLPPPPVATTTGRLRRHGARRRPADARARPRVPRTRLSAGHTPGCRRGRPHGAARRTCWCTLAGRPRRLEVIPHPVPPRHVTEGRARGPTRPRVAGRPPDRRHSRRDQGRRSSWPKRSLPVTEVARLAASRSPAGSQIRGLAREAQMRGALVLRGAGRPRTTSAPIVAADCVLCLRSDSVGETNGPLLDALGAGRAVLATRHRLDPGGRRRAPCTTASGTGRHPRRPLRARRRRTSARSSAREAAAARRAQLTWQLRPRRHAALFREVLDALRCRRRSASSSARTTAPPISQRCLEALARSTTARGDRRRLGLRAPLRELVERYADRLPGIRLRLRARARALPRAEPRRRAARRRDRRVPRRRRRAAPRLGRADRSHRSHADASDRLRRRRVRRRLRARGAARPRWLSDRLLQFAGITRFGDVARQARSSAEWPFGANIAFRA